MGAASWRGRSVRYTYPTLWICGIGNRSPVRSIAHMRQCTTSMLMLAIACLFGGCVGPLAQMLARGPESVARDMGQSVQYNAAGALASSEVAQGAAATAQTVASLDKILEQHPDAANAAEIRRLKQAIADGGGRERRHAGAEVIGDLDGWTATDLDRNGIRLRRARHDRRARVLEARELGGDAVEGQVIDAEEVRYARRLAQRRIGEGPIALERPDDPEQRLRSRDPFRFTQATSTSFTGPIGDPDLKTLTGRRSFGPRWDELRWSAEARPRSAGADRSPADLRQPVIR